MGANSRLTRKDAQAAVTAVNAHGGSVTEASRALGLRRTTLRDRLHTADTVYGIRPNKVTPRRGLFDPNLPKEMREPLPAHLQKGFEVTHGNKETKIWSLGDEVQTVDDALAKAKVDLDKWSIKQAQVKQYVVPMKLNKGQRVVTLTDVDVDAKGKQRKNTRQAVSTQEETPHREVIWLVSVTVVPRAQKWLLDALDEIHVRSLKHAPKYKLAPLPKVPSDLLYEISLFDQHFGKLCWAVETGQNYDLEIAKHVFHNAVQDLLARAGDRPIDRFLFPIGQDLLHIDNTGGTTTAGTHVDYDGRYAKIVEVAFGALVETLDQLILRAPVDVIYVPGNHDKHVSYHIARELDAWYRTTKRVTVDSVFRKRKYYEYGTVLLGLGHADTEKSKWSTLPNLMATEQAQAWARTTHHEWHVGHLHTKQKREMLPVEEVDGVIIRVLSSLSGLDNWHYESGYFSRRAAEAYLWSKSEGYVGHFSVNARE
jgi:hypothetical protein